MSKLKFFLMSIVLLIIASCKKDDDFGEQNLKKSKYAVTNGVYLINEGNFNSGNSSISFMQFEPLEMENNVFYSKNIRPLGDVAQHIIINGHLIYIVVNNSGKIEVVEIDDFSSVATIEGLNSPRYMQIVNEEKAFVTDLYSDSLAVIDLVSNTISGYIDVGFATNNILLHNNKVFATNWTGNKLVVVDTSGANAEHITVAKEPNSMLVDKDGMLWVLCTGGYMHQENAALFAIDPASNTIVKKIDFPDTQAYPSRLSANGSLDTLYFINRDVFRMSIYDNSIPEFPLISGNAYNFYGLAVDPNNNKIYLTDANDYLQAGYFFRFENNGEKIDSFMAGIIPGEMAFNQTYYNASQSGN